MTKYTFLLPAYKIDFLEQSICSIKNQTFTDYKVILSDDCSPYSIFSVYQRACCDDNRFTYRRNEENMGGKNLISHWNLLVDLCETDYLILASDDDVYDSHFLEQIDSLVSKYPQVDVFRSRVNLIDHKGTVLEEDSVNQEFESQNLFLYNSIASRRIVCIANYVFKTSQLRRIGGFVDFPLAWGSDEATVLKMSKNGVAITNGILFSFRKSDINISNRINKEVISKKLQANIAFLSFFDDFVSSIFCEKSTLEQNRFRDFVSITRKHIIDSIVSHSWVVSYVKLPQHVSYLLKIRAFPFKIDVIHFLSSCLYKKFHAR